MQRKQSLSTAAALSALFTLVGCVHVAEPPVTTTEESAEVFEEMLAKSWISTGLSETMERPVVVTGSSLSAEEWDLAWHACMQEQGFPDFQIYYEGYEGMALYAFSNNVPIEIEPAVQLASFECMARHSFDPSDHVLLTDAQLDYIYDYYESWVMPCFVQNDTFPRAIPTREEFHNYGGLWTPYDSADAVLDGRMTHDTLVELCGPEVPRLN